MKILSDRKPFMLFDVPELEEKFGENIHNHFYEAQFKHYEQMLEVLQDISLVLNASDLRESNLKTAVDWITSRPTYIPDFDYTTIFERVY